MPADDAMMATINADAANDLGSQNAFYDPNVHVNFNDASILHSAHQQHHFAPWDIPPSHTMSPKSIHSRFLLLQRTSLQTLVYHDQTPPRDSPPTISSHRTRLIDRTGQLFAFNRHIFSAHHINYLASISQMFMSSEQLPYPSPFTVQAPANPIPRPPSPPRLQSRRLTSCYPFESSIMGQCLRRFDLLRLASDSGEHLKLPFERLHWQSSLSREYSEYLDVL
jgi:hypothetical protein